MILSAINKMVENKLTAVAGPNLEPLAAQQQFSQNCFRAQLRCRRLLFRLRIMRSF